jgi:hypothetical protein
MSSLPDEPSPSAVAAAAEHFIQSLGKAAIARTRRLETTLAAVPEGMLFAADLTLARLWPREVVAAPRQEVIWSRLAGQRSSIKLVAFDAEGRVLLRRSYPVAAPQAGGPEHG